MNAVVVEWLGRGGIAQTSEAWARALADDGAEVAVVTRPGRELAGRGFVVEAAARPTAVGAHLAVVAEACRVIEQRRPGLVVVQNHLLPVVERRVLRAAARVGARSVVVVHDHRHHHRLAGTTVGLGRLLDAADDVVAHTAYVADRLPVRLAHVVPLPLAVGVLDAPRTPPALPTDHPVAGHFGVLTRDRNKGTDVVVELARRGVPGWHVAFAGAGAPAVDGATSLPGFLEPGALAGFVAATAATVLPYRFASQSGAVVLAQALGSVVLATAVGGLAEQLGGGTAGVLLPAGAPVGDWADALAALDEPARARLAEAGAAHARAGHEAFTAFVARAATTT